MALNMDNLDLAQSLKKTLTRIVQCCLVIAGIFGIIRGIGYWPTFSPERLPNALEIITTIIPIWVYAILWFASGVLCVLAARNGNEKGTVGVLGLSFMWAMGYTASWLLGYQHFVPDNPSNRDYLGASVYWTIFLLLMFGRWLATVGYQATSLLVLLLTRGRDEDEK